MNLFSGPLALTVTGKGQGPQLGVTRAESPLLNPPYGGFRSCNTKLSNVPSPLQGGL